MKEDHQLELPNPDQRPRVIDVAGAETLIELARLKDAGARVMMMQAVGIGRWRIHVAYDASALK